MPAPGLTQKRRRTPTGWLRRVMVASAALLGMSALASGADIAPLPADLRLYLNYAAKLESKAVLAHNFCILDPASNAPLEQGRALGHTHLAYVPAVEVAPATLPARAAQARGIPVLARNGDWNSSVLDVTHPGWIDWLVDDVARPAIQNGYDGVFLDTIDSTMRIIMQDPSRAPACRKAVVNAILRLRHDFPGKRIVLNRGFDVVGEVAESIDSVLVEGLYQTWSPEKKEYIPTRVEGTEWLLSHIAHIQAKKLPVFVVDYVRPDDTTLARVTAKRIRARGCIPFVTTPDIQGEELAPLREVPRRIAVLYGSKPKGDAPAAFPADTLTTGLFQGPLEWLGCEIQFFDAWKGLPPKLSPNTYRGVILDGDLELPAEQEEAFADWLLEQQRHGLKLLFSGAVPFTRERAIGKVFTALAMTGGNLPVSFDGTPAGPRPPSQRSTSGASRAVIAPPGANILLTIEGRDALGHAQRTDPAFVATWGGAMLLDGLPEQTCERLDIHAFLQAWLATGTPFPVPDTTTRDGMRAFFAHIDGDGFTARSAVNSGSLCSEVTRDELIEKFPLPLTVSVIESEIEAQVSGLDPLAAPHYRKVAQSIFSLPNVHPASHSYSHPYRWLDLDESNPPNPSPQNFGLKLWANYAGNVSLDREVRGSIEYINRVLAPPDKSVELFLWSGNSRPGAQALRLCRELGVESIGSGTVLPPGLAGLNGESPSHSFWDDETQVYAAGQNPFMCAQTRPAPFFEGAEAMIARFVGTESPRRLKPVNPCCDFHAAAYVTSLRAIQSVFSWCMEQPLHAITARQYAQIVRDAGEARIYQSAPESWLISSSGHLRTFRLPASGAEPDLAASKGVTGWVRHGDILYVHTDGSPVTQLVLNPHPAPHLRLAQCSAESTFRTLDPLKAEFQVSDLRPVQAVFAGAPPRATCALVVNGRSIQLKADDEGAIVLNLPATADVLLDFSSARLADRN